MPNLPKLKCVYIDCTNSVYDNPDDLIFYPFPLTNKKLCDTWLGNSGNYPAYADSDLRNVLICELHFRERCFNGRRLVDSAVPINFAMRKPFESLPVLKPKCSKTYSKVVKSYSKTDKNVVIIKKKALMSEKELSMFMKDQSSGVAKPRFKVIKIQKAKGSNQQAKSKENSSAVQSTADSSPARSCSNDDVITIDDDMEDDEDVHEKQDTNMADVPEKNVMELEISDYVHDENMDDSSQCENSEMNQIENNIKKEHEDEELCRFEGTAVKSEVMSSEDNPSTFPDYKVTDCKVKSESGEDDEVDDRPETDFEAVTIKSEQPSEQVSVENAATSEDMIEKPETVQQPNDSNDDEEPSSSNKPNEDMQKSLNNDVIIIDDDMNEEPEKDKLDKASRWRIEKLKKGEEGHESSEETLSSPEEGFTCQESDVTMSPPHISDHSIFGNITYDTTDEGDGGQYVGGTLFTDQTRTMGKANLLQNKKTNTNEVYKEPALCVSLMKELTDYIGKVSFECKICETKFNHLMNLIVHMRVHDETRSSICNICNRVCPDRNALIKHILTHDKMTDIVKKKSDSLVYVVNKADLRENEKKHKCSICDKRFFHSKSLVEHMRIHYGMAPFRVTD